MSYPLYTHFGAVIADLYDKLLNLCAARFADVLGLFFRFG